MTRVRTALIGCAFLVAGCGGQPAASAPETTTSTTEPTTTTETTETTETTTGKKSSKSQSTSAKRSSGSETTTTTSRKSSSSTVDCSDLDGEGTFRDPLDLGRITRKIVVEDCDPLTSGKGYASRYFSFTLEDEPSSGATAGARFTLSKSESSAVNPRLVRGAVTIKHSTEGVWTGTSPNFTGRYLRIDDIGSGTYTLGFEKLRSPLGSLNTPSFDVVVDPGD